MNSVSRRGRILWPGLLVGGLAFSWFMMLGACSATAAQAPWRVLILSGQNNHDWRQTTPKIKSILTGSGRFVVDTTEHPERCTAESFAGYDAVLSDWNTFGTPTVTNWPEATREALLSFVRSGKGFVVVHAGGSSFYDWPEYQQLAGGFWNLGQTSHGAPHEFTVKPTGDDPITRGIEPFKTTDELWVRPGIAPGARVIATGDGQPVALTTALGKSRGFTILMGHSAEFMNNPGFQTLLLRGTEWACSGKVTFAANAGASVAEDAILQSLAGYRFGDSRKPVLEFEELVATISADGLNRMDLARKLAAFLEGDATIEAKQIALRQLSLIASGLEVSGLAKWVSDPELGYYARQALERIPISDEERVLVALTPELSSAGKSWMYIINSLAVRHYTQVIPKTITFLADPDPGIAGLAIDTLGRVGGSEAVNALLAAEPRWSPALQVRSSAALLSCAQCLIAEGQRGAAAELLEKITAPNRPHFIRCAAFAARLNALGMNGAEALLSALQGGDPVMQTAAVRALRTADYPAVLERAVEQLEQFPPELEVQVITVLGDLQEEAALPALTRAVSNNVAEIRQAAITALGLAGNASSVGVLARAGVSGTEEEKKLAAEALARLRGSEVEATMISALRTSPLPEQRQLMRAIVLRQAQAAVPVLLELATANQFGARREAIGAVGKLGGKDACERLAPLLDAEPEAAASAMAEICRREGTAEPMVGALGKAGAGGKAALLEGLASLGGPQALDAVRAAARSDDTNLRVAAVRALGNWPDAAPLDDLGALAAGTPEAQSKALALRGIARLAPLAKDRPPRNAVETIVAALKTRGGAGEQKALLAALGEIPDETSLQAAQAFADDPVLGAEAKAAVARIKNARANRPAPAFDESVIKVFQSAENLCHGATATNVDGLVPDGQGQGPFAAIDGDPSSYWDETDSQPLYALRVQLPQASTITRLLILGYQHQNYAPREFEVICDGKVVKKVQGAEYENNLLNVELPPTDCRAVELKITGYYGQSPAIRELGIFGKAGVVKGQ